MKTELFKILVADDDATIRLLMQAALEQAGFSVTLACNGEEAIRLFDESTYDMVMLDVDMPLLDGYKVCSRLRKKKGNELPIIMVTGMDDVESIDHAFDVGATDFIAKPINWNLIGYRVLYLKRAYLNLLELKTVNARNTAIFSAIPDAMFILNDRGSVVRVCGYPENSILQSLKCGRTIDQFFREDIAKVYFYYMQRARNNGKVEHFEYDLQVDGKTRNHEARIVSIKSQETLCLIRDITERKESECKIFRLANFDNLTGLPNRKFLSERLKREIILAKDNGGTLAVLLMDIDGFKSINETMGHNTGDEILQVTAKRLIDCIANSGLLQKSQSALPLEFAFARLGGDEFALIIPNLQREEDALIMAHRIQEIMRHPFNLESRDVVLTMSIGIALCPNDGNDAETLLKYADTAMYHAKNEGRDNSQFYNSFLTQQAEKRLVLENDLRNALLNNEFQLVYQPQLKIVSERIQSVEALIRWEHPERGLVSPDEFIPMAEENGLIIPIGEWVLRTACAEAVQWEKDGVVLHMAINLSPIQFKDPDLVKCVLGILTETGLPPNRLTLEVTESTLMNCIDEAQEKLKVLRDCGLHIALDDFGTGYSSMSYLKQLPVNDIKVDKTFISEMLEDKNSLAIVRSIITLSKNLNFTVTAEGIEKLNQAEILKSLGCDYLQGNYFSKPIHSKEIYSLLNRHWPLRATELNEVVHENSRY
ncbi:MAG: EAL domain-containing protein [Burkholderiales bacterium]|nr:EAL domain-containing protein [Nitrosomonas sp.]MCP5273761.1 EAL domain-containing protein [Burkholderiales bacterium]